VTKILSITQFGYNSRINVSIIKIID